MCIKGQLQAFTCDNHEDERVLQGLMAQVFTSGRRPAIITSTFLPHVHDTRKRWGHEHCSHTLWLKTGTTWSSGLCFRAVSHPEYPSVLQALEIEDPVVANCLIDQKGIESILLIEVKTSAKKGLYWLNKTLAVALLYVSVSSRMCYIDMTFLWFCRIAQRLVEWCKEETLHRTATWLSRRMEIRSILTVFTLQTRPGPTFFQGMWRRRSGECNETENQSFVFTQVYILSCLFVFWNSWT